MRCYTATNLRSGLGLNIGVFCGVQDELQQTNLELGSFKEQIKENKEIRLIKHLPYLVSKSYSLSEH